MMQVHGYEESKMRALSRILVLLWIAMWSPAGAANFETPEAAVQSLESAYVSKDIDAVVAAKDFDAEARFILYKSNPALAADTQVVNEAAGVLERSFRDQIQSRGFPQYEKFKCSITGREAILPTLVRLTEDCRLPGGHRLKQTFSILQTQKGWRVVAIPSFS
jgi:hypothetical protein